MKKKSHIITRIALAATVFTTTLAGVMPMTALAATKTITFKKSDLEKAVVTLDSDGGVFTNSTDEELTVLTTTLTGVSKTGFTFKGWDKTTDTENIITTLDNSSITIDGSKLTGSGHTAKITAKWAPELDSISATTTVPTYTVGSTFDKSVITVTATYKDGTTKDVSSSATITPPDLTATGTKTIAISYTEEGVSANTSLNVTVNPLPTVAAPVFTPVPGSDVKTGDTIKFPSSTSGAKVKYYVNVGGYHANTPSASNGTEASTYQIPSNANINDVYYIKAVAYTGSGSTAVQSTVSQAYFTVTAKGATAATMETLRWETSTLRDKYGTIATNYGDKDHGGDSAWGNTVVFDVNDARTFDNGTDASTIRSDVNGANEIEFKLKDVSGTHTPSVKWDFAFKGQGNAFNDSSNGYNKSNEDEQTFYVYSEKIDLPTGYTIGSNGADGFRLKMKVVINKKGASTKGSGNVAAPTFSPASGTVVTPGTKITFSSTTSGVSFRSQSGTVNPTTSSGTAGAQILIPSGASAGEYKLNAIAYTSSSAYSDVASATYTVVTDTSKYAITEGNGQTASSAMPATFTGSGDLGNFKALYVDDVFVPETEYTKASGSTIITLSPTYLQTLSAGNHTVKIVYSDGYATGNFTLTAGGNAATPINGGEYSGGGRAGTGTDDKADLVILFVLFGMVLAGFVVSVYYRNEKIRNSRFMD